MLFKGVRRQTLLPKARTPAGGAALGCAGPAPHSPRCNVGLDDPVRHPAAHHMAKGMSGCGAGCRPPKPAKGSAKWWAWGGAWGRGGGVAPPAPPCSPPAPCCLACRCCSCSWASRPPGCVAGGPAWGKGEGDAVGGGWAHCLESGAACAGAP